MSITEIKLDGLLPQIPRAKKTRPVSSSAEPTGDSVALSREAQRANAMAQNQKLEEIRRRIQEEFYFRPDVTEHVVNALLKDLLR